MRSTSNMGRSLPRVTLTGYQLERLLKKGKLPWGGRSTMYDLYTVAKRKDGSYWLEARGSGALFWMSRWYEIPKAAGKRIFAFDAAVEYLLDCDGNVELAFG